MKNCVSGLKVYMCVYLKMLYLLGGYIHNSCYEFPFLGCYFLKLVIYVKIVNISSRTPEGKVN